MRRALPVLALAVVVLGALTACGPGGATPSHGSSPTPDHASASATPAPSASASAAPTPVPTVGDVAGLAPCTRDSIVPVWNGTDGTAGHLHGSITFGNTHGDTACVLQGYPVVTFDDPEAHQALGAPATHDPAKPVTAIRVDPGSGFAVVDVTITDAGVLGCPTVEATALLATMPGQGDQFVGLDGSVAACTDPTPTIAVTAFYVPAGS